MVRNPRGSPGPWGPLIEISGVSRRFAVHWMAASAGCLAPCQGAGRVTRRGTFPSCPCAP
jgi:hypothetical protein